jgi:hypothetical protein
MENFREENTANGRNLSLKERLEKLEKSEELHEKKVDTKKKKMEFKFPFKWKRELNKSTKKNAEDMICIIFFSAKGIIEGFKLLPLYSGSLIIYKNRAYEFDPRATWLIQIKNRTYKCVAIREIDRRPISNLDWDEVKANGYATDSDEILIKMVTKAVIEKVKKQMSMGVVIAIVVAIIGVAVFLMFKGGG